MNDLPALNVPSIMYPRNVNDVCEIVGQHRRIKWLGNGTKSALANVPQGVAGVSMTKLSGITDHQPSEFLVTALAGTTLRDLCDQLAQVGQYLPFDPPFVSGGATLGGTVAAGLSGAGRLRFGGIRDFIMGIRFVDGLGNVVLGGGRVVKNAAGYDLPKLMIGSAGYLGAIVEVTLKVFPKPSSQQTIEIRTREFKQAFAVQNALCRLPIDLAALDVSPDGTIWIRIEGESAALPPIVSRVQSVVQEFSGNSSLSIRDDDMDVWSPLAEGSFASSDERLVRIPIKPASMITVDNELDAMTVRRRYSAAGNVVWVAWPGARPINQLDECLRHLGVGGTVLTGQVPRERIGIRPSSLMMRRVKQALDPEDRFVGME